jgi:hypothetical protein
VAFGNEHKELILQIRKLSVYYSAVNHWEIPKKEGARAHIHIIASDS